jgi:Zn-dependent protease
LDIVVNAGGSGGRRWGRLTHRVSPHDPRWVSLRSTFPGAPDLQDGRWYWMAVPAPDEAATWRVAMPDTGSHTGRQDFLHHVLTFPVLHDPSVLQELRSRPLVFWQGGAMFVYSPRGQPAVRVRFHDGPAAPVASYPSWWRRAFAGALAVLAKLKLLLVFGSVLVTMALYALLLGWPFAIGFVILIVCHELGHVVAARLRHMPTSLPIFIPFLGAFIGLRQRPADAAEEAFLGIFGPVFGLAATGVAALLWVGTGDPFWAALASAGCLIHVFNLMPVLPLDGGRTVGFWRWLAWIPGALGALAVLFYRPTPPHWQFDPVAVLLIGLVVWSLSVEPRSRPGGYAAIGARARWGYTALWALLLAAAVLGYVTLGAYAV